MKLTRFTLVLACSTKFGLTGAEKFFYDFQDRWPLIPSTPAGTNQCNRTLQSPINIKTADYRCEPRVSGYSFYVSLADCDIGYTN